MRELIKLGLIFLLTFLYAFLRYINFGDVELKDVPTIIINKAVAFTLVIWMFFLLWSWKNLYTEKLKMQLNILQSLIFIHIFLSIVLLSQQKLPKFLENAQLTLWANFTVLTGTITLSLFFFFVKNLSRVNFLLFSIFLKLHLFFMGYKGWLRPENWNGSMPPITLLCFCILLIIDMLVLKTSNK
ncbi:MAG: hypothetical protein N2449_09110 [Bacteroidales bacterium]|nr:hypothetical protein [Bacteroidales bacterium]